MNQELKYQMEHAAVEGASFAEDPGWFFVFVENAGMISELCQLIGEKAEEAEAVLVFAREKDWPSHLDACAALGRMHQAAQDMKEDLVLHFRLTQFFSSPSSIRIRTAFAVPEGYECTAVCLLKEAIPHDMEIRWNVFSDIQ